MPLPARARPARCRRSRPRSGCPPLSSSTSSTLTMFSGRGFGSPTSSGGPAASTSHGSSSRPSTHGQPMRIARERGSQPNSVAVPRAEHEVLEPVGPRDERVLVVVGRVDRRSRAGAPRARRRPARRGPSRRGRSRPPPTRHASAAASAACPARRGRGSAPTPDRARPRGRAICHTASISPFAARRSLDVVPVREAHVPRLLN